MCDCQCKSKPVVLTGTIDLGDGLKRYVHDIVREERKHRGPGKA